MGRNFSHSTFRIPHSALRTRSGISLMEVLVSIFVITVGLLGVLAVIPLGSFALSEANKSDYSGYCGRAGLREIKVQQFCNIGTWIHPVGVNPLLASVIDPYGRIQYKEALFFQEGVTDLDTLNNHPLVKTVFPVSIAPPPWPLYRCSLNGMDTDVTNPQTQIPVLKAQAERVFLWHDDLIFNRISDSTLRPTVTTSTGLTHEGDYSWFFTVSPEGISGIASVSVAVCYKRDFSFDRDGSNELYRKGERWIYVPAARIGGGVGGGLIHIDPTYVTYKYPDNISVPTLAEFLVKENQWVMLYNGSNRCSWYRVVNVGRSVDTGVVQFLTLAGPDWPPGTDAILIVIDGVIGVYTTSMKLQ